MSDDPRRHDRASLEALHPRVCSGDQAAVEEISSTVLRQLPMRLRRLRPEADPGLIESAAEDAILKYLGNPRRFAPSRAGLLTWLEAIAMRRLRDLERPAHRLHPHASAGTDLAGAGEFVVPGNESVVTEVWIAEHRALLLGAARSGAERAFVEARLAGAPRDVQGEALGVLHLPPLHARKEMNRVWELLGRRARRRQRRQQSDTNERRA